MSSNRTATEVKWSARSTSTPTIQVPILLQLKEKDEMIAKLEDEKRMAEEEAKKVAIKNRHLQKRVQSNLFSAEDTAEGGAMKDDDIETLKMWKKVAQCSVCEFRIKSHVILKCMHVFCKECIDARVNTRQRKCPQCGGMFGPNDIKPIYI